MPYELFLAKTEGEHTCGRMVLGTGTCVPVVVESSRLHSSTEAWLCPDGSILSLIETCSLEHDRL